MKATLKGIRRSNGHLYAKAVLESATPLDAISIEAQSQGGTWLPSSHRLLGNEGSAGKTALAIELPLLEGASIIVAIGARSPQGVVTDFITIAPERAKWESRLNYRLNQRLIDELADFPARLEAGDAWLSLERTMPHVDELVAQLVCTTSSPMAPGARLRVFSPDGTEYPNAATRMGHEMLEPEFGFGAPRYETRFTVRLPGYPPSFSAALCENDAQRACGFRTFEPGDMARAFENGRWVWETADVDEGYHDWFCAHRATPEAIERQRSTRIEPACSFSIVTPLFETPPKLLDELVESVCAQSYANWQLVLVNASPGNAELARAVKRALERDGRIRCIELPGNRGIAGNTAAGIEASVGDYVCFLDHDDVIEPDALFEYAREIALRPASDLLYCDEDKLAGDGRFVEARFKPDFDIDLLRTNNYICHFLCVRKRLLDQLELEDARFDGAQDYHLVLQAAERTDQIRHVAKVLYHWRIVEGSTSSAEQLESGVKPQAQRASEDALRSHLRRLGIDAEVQPTRRPFVHHVKYHVSGDPLVSIVIPNKDCAPLLDACVSSVLEKTAYANYEIIIVENNSTEAGTFACYERLQQRDSRIRLVKWPGEFNFSKIVNFGAERARGEYLLLLNNDTEVISGEWLELMVGIGQRDDVGAVGAKLLYADDTIQHAGVVITDRFTGGHHAQSRVPADSSGYFFQLDTTRRYCAVTGACLLTPRRLFEQLGGFEEQLVVAYNDIDYCLKAGAAGKAVVYEPHAVLRHYESVSRGNDVQSTRLYHEQTLIQHRWSELYVEGDPHFNPNLSSAQYTLGK